MSELKVYLCNLPYTANSDDVRELAGSFATVLEVYVVQDRERQRSKGVAFVTAENQQGRDKLIAGLNVATMGRLQLRAQPPRPR